MVAVAVVLVVAVAFVAAFVTAFVTAAVVVAVVVAFASVVVAVPSGIVAVVAVLVIFMFPTTQRVKEASVEKKRSVKICVTVSIKRGVVDLYWREKIIDFSNHFQYVLVPTLISVDTLMQTALTSVDKTQ